MTADELNKSAGDECRGNRMDIVGEYPMTGIKLSLIAY